jgi:L-asparaginase
MKKIEIIATGGTIAGTLSVEDLLASVPDIKSEFGISLFPLLSVDSNEMNITHWIALKKKIDEISSEFDGIVITHGTDTIEETAYFLTLTINTLSQFLQGQCVQQQLQVQMALLIFGKLFIWLVLLCPMDKGVLALFSSTIYYARDIQKISNYKINAFEKTYYIKYFLFYGSITSS